MGYKRKLIVFFLLMLLIAMTCMIVIRVVQSRNVEYKEKLVSILSVQEQTTVNDVFQFEFKRAYVFDDCYLSGDGFSERYNLELSISQVKNGTSENIQRIVFVDEKGKFVYEFKCDICEIVIVEKGLVIYPETIIEKKPSEHPNQLTIQFNSTEHYNS